APVPGLAREAHARVHEASADPIAPRGGLDIKEAQLRDSPRLAHEEDGPDDRPTFLGDPAALARGIAARAELRHDFRDDRLEVCSPAVFPRVEDSMAMD